MRFEDENAEQAYKEIVNASGVAFYELVSRPEDYDRALRENEILRPETLERSDQGFRALKVLEEAGLVSKNGSRRTFDVEEDPKVYGEVFGKIYDRQSLLVDEHDPVR